MGGLAAPRHRQPGRNHSGRAAAWRPGPRPWARDGVATISCLNGIAWRSRSCARVRPSSLSAASARLSARSRVFSRIAAPLSRAAIERLLNQALRDALEAPRVKQRLKELGMQATPMTAAETTTFIEKRGKALVTDRQGVRSAVTTTSTDADRQAVKQYSRQTSKMLPHQSTTDLLRLINGFQVSQGIHVAATVGLADLPASGPRTSADLATVTEVHPAALYRLMRALTSIGLFNQESDHGFSLTPVGQYLRPQDRPGQRVSGTRSLI
jgi:hypothetical protein